MMTMLLRILTILCLMEMMTASGIYDIKSHDRDIEKKSEDSPWWNFGSRFNSLKTDLQALTRKVDALTEKMDAQARKMDAQTQKMDSQTQKVDALTNKTDAQTQKMDRALNRKGCPVGFDYLPEIDQCLKLNIDKMTWTQTHDACRRMALGGQMLTITNSAKQAAVKRYLEKQFTKLETEVCLLSGYAWLKKPVWISGQRKIPNRCDTPFVWKYKQGVEVPFAFTKWLNGQPDCAGNNEQCVHITSAIDYGWNDIPCAWLLCSVCEI